MMIEQLDDVTPEEIGEELTDSPFEPRYVMYMYEYKRDDGRVSYPLCFIYYNPAGCPVDLNMVYGQTTPGLTRLLKATKVRTGLPYCAGSCGSSTAEFALSVLQVFNIQDPEELTAEWLEAEVQKGSGVK